jgi:ELWxxDGT repeat protein
MLKKLKIDLLFKQYSFNQSKKINMKNRIYLLFVIFISVFFSMKAQVLVKDINVADASSDPREFLTIGTKTYFTANNGETGNNLWVTDGTEIGTKLVKDILPNSNSFAPSNFTNYNGMLLFWMSDGFNLDLYKSDGTEVGTVKLLTSKTVYAPNGGFKSPPIVVSNGVAYFIADGFLWKTNATVTGTVKVKSFNYNDFRALDVNNVLYFVGLGTGGDIDGLWKSDGTEAGTTIVKKIPFTGYAEQPILFKNKIYFIARTNEFGSEIWVSDGTEAGTQVLKDINTTTNLGNNNGAFALHATSNALYFLGRSNSQVLDLDAKLWKSDGTAQGTVEVSNFKMLYDENNFSGGYYYGLPFKGFEFKNKFYFFARSTNSFTNLYESDGTTLGTKIVHNASFTQILNSNNQKYSVAATDSLIYYNLLSNLYVSNGTPSGLRLVKYIFKDSTNYSNPRSFHKDGNTVYFSANTQYKGHELWKSDGSKENTVLVKNMNLKSETSQPYAFTKFANNLVFIARDDDEGFEIWKSDGTTNNTKRAGITFAGFGSGIVESREPYFTELNNKLFFVSSDATYGDELRYFDNNLSNITLLKDIYPGKSNNSNIGSLYPFKNKIVFFAYDDTNGREPWITDGTEAGTQILADLSPQRSSTAILSNMVELNNELYFLAYSNRYPFVRFHKTDGTTAGTKAVTTSDFDTTGTNYFSYTKSLMNIRNLLIFPGQIDNDDYPWLWTFDGNVTKKLTQLADYKSFYELEHSFRVFNNNLYFTKNNLANGLCTLWKTDGTEAGTTKISNEFFSKGGVFQTLKNNLYFFSQDSTTVTNLWKINDNGSVTYVKNFCNNVSLFLGSSFSIAEFDNKLYFTGCDDAAGFEIWSSDGTSQGTKLAIDLKKGPNSSSPRFFTVLNNTLYFVADDGITGFELWKLSTTGIFEKVESNVNITVFPNPSQDILTIQSEDMGDFKEAKIYNLKGEIMKVSPLNSNENSINIQSLPPSTYILVMENGVKKAVKKFVKLK